MISIYILFILYYYTIYISVYLHLPAIVGVPNVFYKELYVPRKPLEVDNWEVYLDRRAGGRIGVDIIREFDGSLAVAKIEDCLELRGLLISHPMLLLNGF